MGEKKTILSRRNFLLTVGAGGAASAAAIVVRNASAPAAAHGKDEKRAGKGYKLTQHIGNYYRTTKV